MKGNELELWIGSLINNMQLYHSTEQQLNVDR